MYAVWQTVSMYLITLMLGGNGIVQVMSNTPGTLELRLGAVGNSQAQSPRPYWRILFNATGGVEVQNAGQADYSDAANILSFADTTTINVNIDNFGVNMDSVMGGYYSNLNFRDGNGVLKGQVAYGPSPLNPNQGALYLSAVNLQGNLEPMILIDPRDSTQADSGNNPIVLKVDGAWHRLRRASNGNATLL